MADPEFMYRKDKNPDRTHEWDKAAPLSVSARIAVIRQKIAKAERRFGKIPGSVRLLAVSKKKPVVAIREASEAGQQAFGENYVQETIEKIDQLHDIKAEWHFIGPIQSNKTRTIANHFSWVHSVDRWHIAERLAEQRSADLPPLDVCIQVNVSDEPTKSGVRLTDMGFEHLSELAFSMADLPRIRLRGLMTIPSQTGEFAAQRIPFIALREAFDKLNRRGLSLDTLSMGMSDDMEAAIAEGATIVRIGTAIFGPR
uniref:Pyridoxal phosphate homeostasis protein n=1 Tax=Candidatus Kentrum sp. TUN TaxID=2126343 RepID=A0A450ZNB4_9GAMM|nr:MAG: hypothetical protein BECKTUN1418F_GA0071002_104218 [Candidatus Kentron sp. TUN]VFK55299.1 MAG: hypothetical protein BECKTUN1418D_GA0071000_103021 [Candidatus Kentron sp. TUN]VFK56666.1 MAG: hypothetical protein BECKTUN1418E_GA0071001_104218 [Candidatus Kentron sp. TUN]